MFGGSEGYRRMMERETLKPKNTSVTLGRFGHYFKPYWWALVLTLLIVVVSTWSQVKAPVLIGQAVDCYLTPGAAEAAMQLFAPNFNQQGAAGETPVSGSSAENCTYTQNSTELTQIERLQGLGVITLQVTGLYILSAIATGLSFFLMTWVGQHVLRNLRVSVFEHMHRLSISYYSRHEVGELMSRITNDTETIQQAFNFALISVISGAMLIGWIGYEMFRESVVYALISLSVVPLMIITTIWFSNQARKAFRRTRQEIGSVNAELQESFASVREVQAFSREDENIANFRVTNAANRDANVRAVTFTSALNPTLEAFSYLALGIVAVVGGLLVLRSVPLMGTTISIGLVIVFLTYVQRFNQPIQQIAVLWTNIQSAIAGGERIFGLLDVQPDLTESPIFTNAQGAQSETLPPPETLSPPMPEI